MTTKCSFRWIIFWSIIFIFMIIWQKDGAYYLWIKLSSFFMDMSLAALIEFINIISASSSILSKKFPLSSHVWSMTSSGFWWYDVSSLVFLSSNISSLILVINSALVYFCKVMILFNELSVWKLILRRFEFPITLSLFGVLELFVSPLLKN